MKTYTPKPKDIDRRWWLVDARGAILGRLASEVASILRGKHKPTYAPHLDTGDHVVVVNASKVELSGGKREGKVWYRHSQYPGGLKTMDYERLLAERPERAVEKAVRGMLPKTRLGRRMGRKLHVYAGPEHPHGPQGPEPLGLGEIPGGTGTKSSPKQAKPATPRKKTGAKASSKKSNEEKE